MSQISPPIRILLVCAVAFMAAWMLFLRPKDEAGTPAVASPTPADTRPVEAGGQKAGSLAGKAVEKANEATAAQDARAEQLAGGAGETAATPSSSAAVTPTTEPAATGAPAQVAPPSKAELANVPAGVRRAILAREIIVLGVLSPKGIDDRLVRKELADVDKLHGRVFVHSVPVKRVSRFGAITRGVDVSQTPSVVVVDFGLKATTLVGWVDTKTIDQAVIDAIRNSGRFFTDPYLHEVSRSCSHVLPDLVLLEPASGPEYSRAIGEYGAVVTGLKTDIGRLATPKKWRSFSKATRADMTTLAATAASWHTALGANPTLTRAISTRNRYLPAARTAVKRLNTRFDAHDVLECGSNR